MTGSTSRGGETAGAGNGSLNPPKGCFPLATSANTLARWRLNQPPPRRVKLNLQGQEFAMCFFLGGKGGDVEIITSNVRLF